MKFKILAVAEAEIESARVYLNSQSKGLGARLLHDVEQALRAISTRPQSFAPLEIFPDAPYRRALLKTFRYAIIFEILADEILILAFAHTSRAPNYWLKP